MATDTAHLPLISSLQVSYTTKNRTERDQSDEEVKKKKGNGEQLGKAASYLASFGLGNVQRQPRPGDVYMRPRTSSNTILRPLGLIPDRGERINALRELTKLLSTPPKSAPAAIAREPDLEEGDFKAAPKDGESSGERVKQTAESATQKSFRLITATVDISRTDEAKKSVKSEEDTHVDFPFRLPARSSETPSSADNQPLPLQELKEPVKDDCEYTNTLAQCDIKRYGLSDNADRKLSGPRHPYASAVIGSQGHAGAGNKPPSPPKKGNRLGKPDSRSTSLGYFSFINQAQLGQKKLTDYRRDALDYIPCERCRLRGGRCSKCKTLRTGGGYIILDGLDEAAAARTGRHSRYDYRRGLVNPSGHGDGLGHRKRVQHGQEKDESGTRWDGGGGEATSGGGRHLEGGGVDRGGGGHGIGGWGLEGEGGAGDGRGGWQGGGDGRGGGGGGRLASAHNDEGTNSRRGGPGPGGMGDGYNTGGGGDSSGRTHAAGGAGQGRDRGDGGDLDGHESGRQSVSSQRPGSQLGSRPGSRFGSRPGSSMRKMGRGIERRERTRRGGGEVEKSKSGRMKGRLGGDDDSESGSDDEDGKGRRRRRRGGADGGGDEDRHTGKGDGRHGYDFKHHWEGEEEEEQRGPYTGDLMRFRSRRDDMKALQCTLKELQGIDPLDYLAKYCIIDQEKLPNYRRVYDNVDRDEDDEIDIMELDFALKAVNYNLISDAEMNYVHSVLELAGRYRLNFRLFSLIAALSEKVVALDDMVKRLINTMDFEALEVKMKKCKELFYLLADAEQQSQEEGGVVTSSSLAVELQAGGLTMEHVEFVVNRLNHQNKGIVEFLDYLTYVPLFLEIHDSISGNPLDFSRTK